jgi:hypothetical protein
MKLMRCPRSLTAVLAGAALLAAGCGSSGHSPSAGTGSGNGNQGNGVQAAFKFASCMRNHGVASFPEPQVSSSGGSTSIRIAVPASAGQSPSFKSAQQACRGILPEPQNLSPAQLAAQQKQRRQYLLAFARCLRAHGLSNFPDPTSQGQLTIEMIDAAGVNLHQPGVLTAARACVGVTHGAITGAMVEQAISHQS